MAHVLPPAPGRPYALIEPAGERSIMDLDRGEAIALYKAHGALLLRGFGADLAAFRDFARQFCKTAVINESPGRDPLDPAHRIHSVDRGGDAFALHPELSREPWKPDAAFFGCLEAPGEGGETTICDGIALVEALPEAVRDGLIERRLVYPMGTWPALLDYWLGTPTPDDAQLAAPPPGCPYAFQRLPDGRIVRHFSRPALHRPMFADAPAFGNFLLFARFNNGRGDFPVLDDLRPVPEAWLQAIRAAGEATLAEVAWRPGDVLMLDNTRFMHGRRAILQPGERRIATFFGYLDFALPDPEEPPDPIWRREDFEPPRPPLPDS
ncbi:MAG TPA: TauD/TfdA family dioxygenase [Novosphingobium sp.]|nr:TauD/TfdA family dioxygenase [Novosphingobium sp.]